MDKIVFLSNPDVTVEGKVTNISSNLCTIEFIEVPSDDILTSGFYIANDYNDTNMTGEYFYEFKTIYRNDKSPVIWLSNDGSKWEPETENVIVNIVWNDNNNEDGVRPESVKVKLMNDEEEIDSAVISQGTMWSHDFGKFEVPNTLHITCNDVDEYFVGFSRYTVRAYHESMSNLKVNKISNLRFQRDDKSNELVTVYLESGAEEFIFNDVNISEISEAYYQAAKLIELGRNDINIPLRCGNKSLYLPSEIVLIYNYMMEYVKKWTIVLDQLIDQVNKMTDKEAINNVTLAVESLDEVHMWNYQIQMEAEENVLSNVTE